MYVRPLSPCVAGSCVIVHVMVSLSGMCFPAHLTSPILLENTVAWCRNAAVSPPFIDYLRQYLSASAVHMPSDPTNLAHKYPRCGVEVIPAGIS